MTKRTLLPQAEGKFERFKMEVASDTGLDNIDHTNEHIGDIPSSTVEK